MDIANILVTLVAALAGAWIGAYGQFLMQKRTQTADMLFQFRIQLRETENVMWKATYYSELESALEWLFVAATDRRAMLDVSLVERFASHVRDGYRCRVEAEEHTADPGIPTRVLDAIREARNDLDDAANRKIKALVK